MKMIFFLLAVSAFAGDDGSCYQSPSLEIEDVEVKYMKRLDLLVFTMETTGRAGLIHPRPNGAVNGAPVLGYVFPTTLAPQDVGFRDVEGTVALAVTSHPDFDDTPLWDEDNNRDYNDDGAIYHVHWVVLGPDERVPGGLAVIDTGDREIAAVLPPTSPGMPLYLDSPGFSVVFRKNRLTVLVPAQRTAHRKHFRYDAVTAFMKVSTDEDQPMLGVHYVYDILSGDLSLPYEVQ